MALANQRDVIPPSPKNSLHKWKIDNMARPSSLTPPPMPKVLSAQPIGPGVVVEGDGAESEKKSELGAAPSCGPRLGAGGDEAESSKKKSGDPLAEVNDRSTFLSRRPLASPSSRRALSSMSQPPLTVAMSRTLPGSNVSSQLLPFNSTGPWEC
jgi:hypothetical protein